MFNTFPLKVAKSAKPAQILKMSSANTICLIFGLIKKNLYEVCMTDYAESYILGQQLSLACTGHLAPRACQVKLLTQFWFKGGKELKNPCNFRRQMGLIDWTNGRVKSSLYSDDIFGFSYIIDWNQQTFNVLLGNEKLLTTDRVGT